MAASNARFRDRPAAAALMCCAACCIALAAQEPEPRPAETGPPLGLAGDAAAEQAPAVGDETVVVTREGKRLSGRLVSADEKRVVLSVAGIDLIIPRADVERVMAQRPLLARYREMRSLIDDGDAVRLLVLARWLMTNGLIGEAIAEVDHVLRTDPTNTDAAQLRALLGRQSDLLEQGELTGLRAPGEHGEAEPREEEERGREAANPFPLLTPQQINLIKVYELDLDRPPRMMVSRETVERLMQRYADNPLIPATREGRERFLALPPAEVLNVMFRLQAREFYGEVRVMENPASMLKFRDEVNRGWLATSCASSQCHGGEGAGRLRLYNRRLSSEAAYYTNFLILERFKMSDGTPLINYKQPERSPLIQLGLPRQDSLKPHPEARNWTATFKTLNDRRIGQTVDWVRSMYQPRPDHPVDYAPPVVDLPPKSAPGAPGVPR